MRLITVRTFKLVEHYGDSIPHYAILSHTWGREEVTYQNMQSLTEGTRNKPGWSKIEQACKIALQHELDFLWVDTCCIDKTNSVELGEAINSMFQWYRNSALCIAYLADLHSQFPDPAVFTCRWWQRGWTLQELIAPSKVHFYNASWQYSGSKLEWQDMICNHTGVPSDALQGDLSPRVGSVAQKLSWAADRKTTRIEDEAYSLLGLFNVNIPLLYGEGRKAFRRLQEEIIKAGNDVTIFAHSPMQRTGNLFAERLSDFRGLGNLRQSHLRDSAAEFSLTNSGLHIARGLLMHYVSARSDYDNDDRDTYYASLGANGYSDIGICLVKSAPQAYCRDDTMPLVGYGSEIKLFKGESWDALDCYILPQGDRYTTLRHAVAISLPPLSIQGAFGGMTTDSSSSSAHNIRTIFREVVPRGMFYYVPQLILAGHADSSQANNLNTVIALRGSLRQTGHRARTFVVLINLMRLVPVACVFEAVHHQHLMDFMFAKENSEKSVSWQYLRVLYPQVEQLGSSIRVSGDGFKHSINIRFSKVESHRYAPFTLTYALQVEVKKS